MAADLVPVDVLVDCAAQRVHQVVQVGSPESPRLLNAIDTRGRTTFRTAAGLVAKAKLFLSTEGGLVHAAAAFDVPSVVIITGYEHPDMVAYSQNTNLWIHGDHGPCGMKIKCKECWRHVDDHDESNVIEAARRILNAC